jgi:3-deoxy-manno-octulosonate cytidylyltransferase (CMP-KDO synthetase)
MAAMQAIGVIPARMESRRFPGKVLAPIGGLPVLRRVWEGARTAKTLRDVLVATDDDTISAACRDFGAEVVRTRADHPTGSDRLAEVAGGLDDAIIVNIQGDEPLIEGFVVDAAVEALHEDPDVPMASVVHAAPMAAVHDPNRVKVALDRRGRALYFSRNCIPALRPGGPAAPVWQHVGVYAYRRPFLLEFAKLARGTLEQAEGLEQLRALEHGYGIRCAVVEDWHSTPVDVPDDILRVETRLRELGRL